MKKESSRGFTLVYKAQWKVSKGKKVEVALKMLKPESQGTYLKEFLELGGQYAFLQSSAIVRLYGITLSSNVFLVQEYLSLGSLDKYLREKREDIKQVDLIEAASNVASALWHLKENNIVHGNIRCRKLMVSTHDENSFTVKLTDPGINVTYTSEEVHWIPLECYSNLNFAKHSTAADVWSFATTLWEIFMYGDGMIPVDYASGQRLPKPPECPNEIYALMRECWNADPHRRKQPQAVMRDINQILYQVFNSRRTHSYAKVYASKTLNSVNQNSYPEGNLVALNEMGESFQLLEQNLGHVDSSQDLNCEDARSYEFSNIFSSINLSTASTSLNSINAMESIFEFDESSNVILQGRIGQGFYGEVYKGTLECIDEEPRRVAIKKMKASTVNSSSQDFEREIEIMRSLKHPNVVQILGVLGEAENPLLIMEFVQDGSLDSYLKNRERLHTKQLLKYALDIANGMDYLGTKNIVHRDLAARNILVVDENHVKISDFGLAQVMGTDNYYILKTNRDLPIKWYAPESLSHGKFSVRSDVWSYGVTMCETFNGGEEPKLATASHVEKQDPEVLLKALKEGARYPCPSNCPNVVYIRIIYPCWQGNPRDRPSFSNLVKETLDLLKQY